DPSGLMSIMLPAPTLNVRLRLETSPGPVYEQLYLVRTETLEGPLTSSPPRQTRVYLGTVFELNRETFVDRCGRAVSLNNIQRYLRVCAKKVSGSVILEFQTPFSHRL